MKKWTSEGHLTDLALDLRATGEPEAHALEAIDRHLQRCPACRAREAEWRELIDALAALSPLEPSPSFDNRVMARVRLPAHAKAARTAWLPRLARRLQPVAVGAAAIWSAVVFGGAAWLDSRLDVSAATLFASLFDLGTELLWPAVIKIGAILHLSGLTELWAELAGAVPGPGVLSAVALMTALSGLALWTLYRVTGHQSSKVDAHV